MSTSALASRSFVRVRFAQLATQAVAIARPGGTEHTAARNERARLIVAIVGPNPVTALQRRELQGAAAELLELGEGSAAAEAFRALGDVEGEARGLEAAGDVEGLEKLLDQRSQSEISARKRAEDTNLAEDALSRGDRRAALAAFERELAAHPNSESVLARIREIQARRLSGPSLTITAHGQVEHVWLGGEITVGRSDADLVIPSHALSRRHIRIACGSDGVWQVKDLASRNGTFLRGAQVTAAIDVGDGIDLSLGNQVLLTLRPDRLHPQALRITSDSLAYEALLVHRTFSIAPVPASASEVTQAWTVRIGHDRWLELCGAPLFRHESGKNEGLQLDPQVTLLDGDTFGCARGGQPIVNVRRRS
jgi:pSer/pThr/pTyr-binding forkhead associated (FHA) protein